MGTEQKETQKSLPLPPGRCTPHGHTWESKGAKRHPRNPAQYPGISSGPCASPFSASYQDRFRLNSSGPLLCPEPTTQEKQSNILNFNLLLAHISISSAFTDILQSVKSSEFVKLKTLISRYRAALTQELEPNAVNVFNQCKCRSLNPYCFIAKLSKTM